MSVSSITSGAGVNPADWRSTVKQGKQDFNQLMSSLQSGDLAGAQQAYSAMQQLLPASAASATTSPGSATTSTVSTDFSALGTALSSGSLSGAQNTVDKLQQDAQAYMQSRFSNQGATGAINAATSSSTGSANASNSTSVASASNPINTDVSALSQTLKSGDTTSIQQAFAQLQQDLQSSQLGAQQAQGAEHHHRHHHRSGSGTQNAMASYIANSVIGSSTTATTGTIGGSGSVSTSA